MNIFCLGMGVSLRVWHQRSAHSRNVSACARSAEKMVRLEQQGIATYLWDADMGLDAAGVAALQQAEVILVSAPPSAQDDLGDPYFSKIANIIDEEGKRPIIVYLSSTNVYGNTDGGWVDERSVLRPTSTRGEARSKAEQQWQSLKAKVHVFRLAGIYGDQRNQLLKLKAGKARYLIKPDHVFNRIHEWDIAAAIDRALTEPKAGVYNLADDLPAPPQEVLEYAAIISGYPLPRKEYYHEDLLSGLAREFYRDNKRVDNTRLKNWLGRELHFPNYRIGLNAIFQKM